MFLKNKNQLTGIEPVIYHNRYDSHYLVLRCVDFARYSEWRVIAESEKGVSEEDAKIIYNYCVEYKGISPDRLIIAPVPKI